MAHEADILLEDGFGILLEDGSDLLLEEEPLFDPVFAVQTHFLIDD